MEKSTAPQVERAQNSECAELMPSCGNPPAPDCDFSSISSVATQPRSGLEEHRERSLEEVTLSSPFRRPDAESLKGSEIPRMHVFPGQPRLTRTPEAPQTTPGRRVSPCQPEEKLLARAVPEHMEEMQFSEGFVLGTLRNSARQGTGDENGRTEVVTVAEGSRLERPRECSKIVGAGAWQNSSESEQSNNFIEDLGRGLVGPPLGLLVPKGHIAPGSGERLDLGESSLRGVQQQDPFFAAATGIGGDHAADFLLSQKDDRISNVLG